MAWFRDEQREAFEDFWRVYVRCRESIRGSSWFGASAGQTVEEERRALSGDSPSLKAFLTRRGAARTEEAVSLRSALGQARLLGRALMPQLVEAYAAEPARLARVIALMNDLGDFGATSVGEAYLEHKEAAVRAQEEDLAITLDSIGDGVIVTDEVGHVRSMNPVAQKLTGFTLEQALGRPLDAVFRCEHEETGENVESPVARVLREGTVAGLANQTVLVDGDGVRRPIADSAAPIKATSGAVRGVVLVFRDVTEERHAQATLRHWERIFQHATWGVALAGIDDLVFRAVNPMYAKMHGYTVDELMGNKVSTLWTADTQADMQRHARATREHGKLVAETTHLCKDGSTLPVEVVATTIANERGKLAWFVANVQDISERRQHQHSQIRAIELEAENRRIDEANRLKSEFLANMSHELRTPLNSIIGFAELLHDEQVGPVEEKQKEFLGDILAGASHLLRLINDVLDLSKVEAGKMEFRPEPVALPSLVEKVVQSLHAVASKKRLKVEVSAEPGLEDVTLDPSRFKQLLYNYVSNALKFTPEGGHISVRLLSDAPAAFRLEVEDTGPGVPERDVPRLFVPFQQLDSGVAKAHGGTGLGLALSKRLAEAQGGTVGMRRGTHGGSIFFAVLPRRPADGGATSEQRADAARATRLRPRVLDGADDEAERAAPAWRGTPVVVVDDDASSLKLMEATLGQLGYEVLCFSKGTDALRAIERGRPLAVVLDLLMPSMDGFAFVERFRASAENRAVPLLIWTVKDLSTEERARLGDMPVSVVQKGVDDGEPLSAALRAFLPPRRKA
jgi:PAS domain S-box-containing protein